MTAPLAAPEVVPEIDQLRFLSEEEVRRVRDTYGTPAFVYDEASIEAQARMMLAYPNAFGLTVRYSIKANASGAILKMLHNLGLLFDASSIWEVKRAVAVGVPPANVLLTAQEYSAATEELIRQGMEFTAGSLHQIDLYGKSFPGSDISLRLNPGTGSGFINRLTSGGSKSSFGIWHEQIPQAIDLTRKHGLRVKRIHHHIGSGHDPMEWCRISAQTLDMVKTFGKVPIVNLGGGYPVRALISDHATDYHAIGEMLRKSFLLYAEQTGNRPQLEIEPGTLMMANSGSLVASIIDTVSTGNQGFDFLKIDSGLTELMRPGFYGAPHPLVSVAAQDGGAARPLRDYVVSGHCCVAGDVLTTERRNPEALEPRLLPQSQPGDILVVERAGGYCASMCVKNFNSFPEAPEVLRRKDGTMVVIRSRQTFAQLIENEIVPAFLA